MNKPVTGVLIDVENRSCGAVTMDGTLQGYYKALNCSCIDIPTRSINKKRFSIFCDDEGLLKEGAFISAMSKTDNQDMLVGNLFICNVDEEGNTISLTGDEINSVSERVYWHGSGGNFVPLLILD